MFKFLVVFALVLLVGAAWLPAQAASSAVIEYAGSVNPDNVCTHGLIDFYATYTPDTDDGYGGDSIGLTVVDGYGNPLWAQLSGSGVSSEPISEFFRIPLGTINGAINDIAARPVTAYLYDTTITYSDIDGWSAQQIFDTLTVTGTLLAQTSGDPAFGDFGQFFCDDLPVPGYTFKPLQVYSVCTSYYYDYVIWRVRNDNLVGLRFTYFLPQYNFRYDAFVWGTINARGLPYMEREIYTGAAPGRTIFQVYVNGRLEDIAINNPKPC